MAITLKNLNAQQQQAVTAGDGPLLIVAGAGTGKTTVITQRIGWLIEQEKAKPHEILALTFTEKAAEEMEERTDKLLPYGYVDLWISTFHAFAEKVLQRDGIEIGLPPTFKMLSQTEQWLLIRKNLDTFNLDYYKPLGNPTKFIHALIKLFSRAKDENIRPEEYLAYAEELRLNADGTDFIKTLIDEDSLKELSAKEKKELVAQEILKNEEVANAYHTYQQLLLENEALDFGDLINYCLELFQKRPAILARWRKQFKYILVDEFQDTNHAQYELVKLLAEPANNIMVVGDDDQSIYKFRGASVSNIIEFKKDYPKSEEILLTHNYRSSQNILDLSHIFIQQNDPDRLEAKLKLSKQLQSNVKDKGVIEHLHYATSQDEVFGVIHKIIDLKEAAPEMHWNDFAILARTNDAANTFVQGLRQTNVPFQFVATRGLYTKDIVADVLAYLQLLDDYHESGAVFRVLNAPIMALSPQDITKVNYWAKRKGYSLFQTLKQQEIVSQLSEGVQKKINALLGWVSTHTQLAKEKSVGQVVMAFLQDSGYLELLSKKESVESMQATAFLNQFYKKIVEFEQSTDDATVAQFLELVNLEMESGDAGTLPAGMDEGPEAVKVMTIHAAKGLEFKHVFIVNMVDRRFPVDDRKDPITLPEKLIKEILPEGDAHLQEERRLFYVAMTRAKRGLYFTSAEDYGGARCKKISRFLQELVELGFPRSTEAIAGNKTDVYQLDKPGPQQLTAKDLEHLLPRRFSFTQLKRFKQCPYHYWLEFVLRVPQPGKNIFSFGSSVHNTLQKFFELVQERHGATQQDLFGEAQANYGKDITEKELMELYEKNWIDDWYITRKEHDEYKAKGRQILKDFYQAYLKEKPVPKFLEQSFSLPIQDGDDQFIIVGKIDRIDPIASGVKIIDYKTGKGKTTKSLDADDKQQLLIYQLAAQEVFNETVEELAYYYLETGELATVAVEQDVEKIKQKILKTIREIRATKFPLPPSACTCSPR